MKYHVSMLSLIVNVISLVIGKLRKEPVLLRRTGSAEMVSKAPLKMPSRYMLPGAVATTEPPSIAEVERNITIFLRTLHTRLQALASPTISPMDALNAYMDVTKNTLLKWDDWNKDRYHRQRRFAACVYSVAFF